MRLRRLSWRTEHFSKNGKPFGTFKTIGISRLEVPPGFPQTGIEHDGLAPLTSQMKRYLSMKKAEAGAKNADSPQRFRVLGGENTKFKRLLPCWTKRH